MLAITRSEVGEQRSMWLAKLSSTRCISYFMSLIQLKIRGKLGKLRLIVEIEKNKQTHVLSIISSKAL